MWLASAQHEHCEAVKLVSLFTLRRSLFPSKNTGVHWQKPPSLRIAQRPNPNEIQDGGAF
jgi:hypothetical protein